VNAVSARALPRGTSEGREFSRVLAGVLLDGEAARLAAALDPAFLDEAGWDPVRRVLSMPAGHRLLGRTICKLSGCETGLRDARTGVCCRCLTRLKRSGMTEEQIKQAEHLPPAPGRTTRCAVPGCQRGPASAHADLCKGHAQQSRRMRSPGLEQFLADPGVRPLGPAPASECAVCACTRPTRSCGFCDVHYQRWMRARRADPCLDAGKWGETQQPATAGGLVGMYVLVPLVTVQVLAGLQQRTLDGAKTSASDLRMACRALASQRVTAIGECDIGRVPGGTSARPLLRALARHARLAVSDPGSEQDRDTWDLAVFGHRGQLDFTGITQRWLRESAKRWAAHDLPRHRGTGASNVGNVVSSAARLSDSLRTRPDRGDQPAALGRRDIESFLSRLAYLETAGTISRFQRNLICRGTRTVLAAVRDLSLARAGQPAAGLAGDFGITRADIPALPERGEPGRDLPAEIMTALCAALDELPPGEIKTAVQIAMDTGRRPEEIMSLPLDCLTRDASGAPVLIYDNLKRDREGRRLPVSEHTAAVITAQQERVTGRYPATPRSRLALLPTPKLNPGGSKNITVDRLEERHREWVTSLGPLRTSGGAVFDSAKIVLYAYRHTYAQRHADAGVPIGVLAELLDHKDLSVTRGYYRVGEDRRRDAIDKVTAMSFDRHGNRTWREARALLDTEHARYAIGQVAVPYGTCTEPSNVAAGGGACPVRFRCAGCDHFRTDVSYLPDLTAHLDDLLRTRERLAAMTGVDDWARASAAPPEEEITRIRRLIARIEGDITHLNDGERAAIGEAVAVIRKHRAVNLGMPAIRTRTAQQEETA
jgi:integrase